MLIIGGLIFLFGLVDLIGNFAGFDIWTEWIKVELPEMVWRFSAYIELVLGWFLIKIGRSGKGKKSSSGS